MHSKHSVSSHLRLDTMEYDRIIRTYIPHYDESRRVQLDLLAAALAPSAIQIIDLGGGTGSLAEAILDRFSQCTVLVRDIDREMLSRRRAFPALATVLKSKPARLTRRCLGWTWSWRLSPCTTFGT